MRECRALGDSFPRELVICSGAMYGGVPPRTGSTVEVAVDSPDRAMPKSETLGTSAAQPAPASPSSRILDGLRSR